MKLNYLCVPDYTIDITCIIGYVVYDYTQPRTCALVTGRTSYSCISCAEGLALLGVLQDVG